MMNPTPQPEPSPAEGFAWARHRMVELQLRGHGRGIRHPRVLEAMGKVPRHEFVPSELRAEAYADHPLPIGFGQTISQPYIVAYMTEQLAPGPTDRVLEIGTGCGYQAAVLAEVVAEVYSVEIVPELAARAQHTLAHLGYDTVRVQHGNGHEGWPEAAPFDGVIVTCAPDRVPTPLIEQLKVGGRVVIPLNDAVGQTLVLLEKRADAVHQRALLPVRFVPMTGTHLDSRC